MAPHTSDWDVVYSMGAAELLGVNIQVLIVDRLFKGIRGPILRSLGGIPVNKEKNEGMVSKAVQLFKEREELILAVNPEGGKYKCKRFRTGFYQIAKQANVPIYLFYVDYQKKVVGVGPKFVAANSMEDDLRSIWNYYKDKRGKYPENGMVGEVPL